MTRPFDVVLHLPFGALGACLGNTQIQEIVFLPGNTPARAPSTALGHRFAEEISAYVVNPAHQPQLPLADTGTPFRRRVWQAIGDIPAGQTRSYGDIARLLGSAPRAVGQACGDNPYPVVVACHRVLARSGLGGFAHDSDGWLIEVKRWLLQHEACLQR